MEVTGVYCVNVVLLENVNKETYVIFISKEFKEEDSLLKRK